MGSVMELRTFVGFGKPENVLAFFDMESAMRAFMAAPYESIPRLQIEGETVVELEFDEGLRTLFWGPDASELEASFDRLCAL